LSVPVAVRKVPAARPEMVSAVASSSPWRLYVSCTAPDSSRRITNWIFFWSRTVSTHPETATSPSSRAARFLIRVRVVTVVESIRARVGPVAPRAA
jgi:hypothetical protein